MTDSNRSARVYGSSMATNPHRMVGMEHVVLVGPMGVGKTTAGSELASRLGRPFLDSDIQLERRDGVTAAEIATRDGVERLHTIELEIFLDMVEADEPSVISPAASVIDTEQGRKILDQSLVIWLDAPEDVLAERRGSDGHRRHVDEDEATDLERRRRSHWERLARTRIDTARPVAEVVDELASEVRRVEAGWKSA